MVYRSNIDSFYIRLITAAILIVASVSFIPLFFGEVPTTDIILNTGMFTLITALILWSTFTIRYVFMSTHLYVKAGPFRSRIPYSSILKVSPTRDIFTGYRLLSSRNALELINNHTIFGTVKISPTEQEAFLAELQKRCPGMKLDEKFLKRALASEKHVYDNRK